MCRVADTSPWSGCSPSIFGGSELALVRIQRGARRASAVVAPRFVQPLREQAPEIGLDHQRAEACGTIRGMNNDDLLDIGNLDGMARLFRQTIDAIERMRLTDDRRTLRGRVARKCEIGSLI